ncbi:MAG: hypothetical protein AAB657_04425 [Patescibacteria group bacterium]
MTDEEKIKKIESIYADFERKILYHRTRAHQVIHNTLKKIDHLRADEILKSLKQNNIDK